MNVKAYVYDQPQVTLSFAKRYSSAVFSDIPQDQFTGVQLDIGLGSGLLRTYITAGTLESVSTYDLAKLIQQDSILYIDIFTYKDGNIIGAQRLFSLGFEYVPVDALFFDTPPSITLYSKSGGYKSHGEFHTQVQTQAQVITDEYTASLSYQAGALSAYTDKRLELLVRKPVYIGLPAAEQVLSQIMRMAFLHMKALQYGELVLNLSNPFSLPLQTFPILTDYTQKQYTAYCALVTDISKRKYDLNMPFYFTLQPSGLFVTQLKRMPNYYDQVVFTDKDRLDSRLVLLHGSNQYEFHEPALQITTQKQQSVSAIVSFISPCVPTAEVSYLKCFAPTKSYITFVNNGNAVSISLL